MVLDYIVIQRFRSRDHFNILSIRYSMFASWFVYSFVYNIIYEFPNIKNSPSLSIHTSVRHSIRNAHAQCFDINPIRPEQVRALYPVN